jgi:hypothetical protein
MPIPDFQTYSKFVYSLQERYGSIQHSTLVLVSKYQAPPCPSTRNQL